MATACDFTWDFLIKELKPIFGNRKNWKRFYAVASRLHWKAYTSTLFLTKI